MEDLGNWLTGSGIAFSIGPFHCSIRSDFPELAIPLAVLYRDYPLASAECDTSVSDFDIEISSVRKQFLSRPEAVFRWKGHPPLPALPASQVHPLFEWGLNWCIATLLGTEIVIHAAIVERNHLALVLPGEPGAGKSTLCAALSLSGWRLLSDELTVISINSGFAYPIPRPISLKDQSIELITKRYPDAVLTTPVSETRKGMIAYVRPPSDAISRWKDMVPIRHFLFPSFQKDAGLSVTPMTGAESLAKLLASTFNVGLLGHAGFSRLATVVAGATNHMLKYGNTDSALDWIDRNCL